MSENHNYNDLSIVIPAYCEEGGISGVLDELRKNLPGAEIIVVDDGSDDKTAETALKFKDVIVYQHRFNRGYGASLVTGMKVASRPYIAWMDADAEHRAENLIGMFKIISSGKLAAVIGQRTNRSATKLRGVGKFGIRMIARMMGVNAGPDLNCGLRIFQRDVILPYLSILPNRYSASLTTTFLMVEREYPVEFFPITTSTRIGKSKVKIRDGFLAIAKIMHLITLLAPMRIFFRLGCIFCVVGFIYGLIRTFNDKMGFPIAGLLAIMVGLILIVQGLIADQISKLRLNSLSTSFLAKRLDSTMK